jgi:hypothetical protein
MDVSLTSEDLLVAGYESRRSHGSHAPTAGSAGPECLCSGEAADGGPEFIEAHAELSHPGTAIPVRLDATGEPPEVKVQLVGPAG